MRNAIVYLLNAMPKDMWFFRKSIYLLNQHYLNYNPCDVICFYEANFPQDEMENIQRLSPAWINFIPIEFKIPDYPPELASKIPDFVPHPEIAGVPGFPIGYRHMCNFFAGEIFKHEALKDYKYIWRLDTDSLILDKVVYNVFDTMARIDAKYGYINIQLDHPKMTAGLWDTATDYFANNSITPLIDINAQEHVNRVFYTNFEIYDMDWFRSDNYQNYYNAIREAGGIYTHRWGDHCIRYIGVNALVPQDQIHFFNDIHYFHTTEFYNCRVLDSHG